MLDFKFKIFIFYFDALILFLIFRGKILCVYLIYVVIFRQKNRKNVYKNNLLIFYFSNIEYTTVYYIYNYDECLQIIYNVNCNINEFQHLFKMLNIENRELLLFIYNN